MRRRRASGGGAALLALLAVAGCASGSVTTTSTQTSTTATREESGAAPEPTATPEPTTAPVRAMGSLDTPGQGAIPSVSRAAARREPTPAVPKGHRCDSWVEWGERPDHGRGYAALPDDHGDSTVVIRTDRSDDAAWAQVRRQVLAGAAQDRAEPLDIRFVDEAWYDGIAPQALLAEDSDDYDGRYVALIADGRTMREREHTLVVVLLLTDGLERYRVTPGAAAKLVRLWDSGAPGHTGDRDACDLARASDRDGVYRG